MARVAGAGAATGIILLWIIYLFFNPYSTAGFTFGTYLGALFMIGVAAAGIHASLTVRPVVMYLVFALSFFPGGFSSLLTPGLFALFGYLNLLFLFSAVLIHLSLRGRHRGEVHIPVGRGGAEKVEPRI